MDKVNYSTNKKLNNISGHNFIIRSLASKSVSPPYILRLLLIFSNSQLELELEIE